METQWLDESTGFSKSWRWPKAEATTHSMLWYRHTNGLRMENRDLLHDQFLVNELVDECMSWLPSDNVNRMCWYTFYAPKETLLHPMLLVVVAGYPAAAMRPILMETFLLVLVGHCWLLCCYTMTSQPSFTINEPLIHHPKSTWWVNDSLFTIFRLSPTLSNHVIKTNNHYLVATISIALIT